MTCAHAADRTSGAVGNARLRGEESETLRRVQAKAEEVLALSEAFFTLSKLEAETLKLPCAAVDLSERAVLPRWNITIF